MKENYERPDVNVVEIKVELGFALTGGKEGNGAEDFNPGGGHDGW